MSAESSKQFTLRQLIAETYTEDEPKYYGFADRGNGAGFGKAGQLLRYDDDAARRYGDLLLTSCPPTTSEDGHEFVYASDWQDVTEWPGYQFRILF